jgi:hypothetical protein
MEISSQKMNIYTRKIFSIYTSQTMLVLFAHMSIILEKYIILGLKHN